TTWRRGRARTLDLIDSAGSARCALRLRYARGRYPAMCGGPHVCCPASLLRRLRATHAHDLGEDAERDLLCGERTDLHACRRVELLDRLSITAHLLERLLHLVCAPLARDETEIARLQLQGCEQRLLVEHPV